MISDSKPEHVLLGDSIEKVLFVKRILTSMEKE